MSGKEPAISNDHAESGASCHISAAKHTLGARNLFRIWSHQDRHRLRYDDPPYAHSIWEDRRRTQIPAPEGRITPRSQYPVVELNITELQERVCAVNRAIGENGLAPLTWGNA